MILALDVGNSNIVLGCMEKGEILFTGRVATDRLKTDDEYAVIFESILNMSKIDPKNLEGGIICSVVPPLNNILLSACYRISGKRFLQMDTDLSTGLELNVENPAGLGKDRIADAVAAVEIYSYPVIIFDLGTCTTVSVVDNGGRFAGGIICAGVRISQEALTSQTAQLTDVSLERPKRVIGRNTADSMRSGALYGTAATVDGLIDRLRRELGRDAPVVMTGGIGKKIHPYCRREINYDGNLLLKGLWKIYNMNCGNAASE